MGLTKQQAEAAAASILVLAANEDQAHPMHVKTPQGAKFYKQPIGSLIIAKPHIHELTEHQRLVYAGPHAFAIPHDAQVYVASGTDMGDYAAVAAAIKLVLLKPPNGGDTVVKIFPNGKMGSLAVSPGVNLPPLGWKTLLPGEQKMPVVLHGKLVGWVPLDWKLYLAGTSQPWAKLPDGEWRFLTAGEWKSSPSVGLSVKSMDASLVKGNLTPFEGSAELPGEAHVPPGAGSPAGPSAGKVTIGGIPATADQISSAITILQSTQSTAVKQPLAAKSHPLAGMAYHDVSKAEIKAHPELKLKPGSKQKHVGQVKIAVLHHLASKLEELGSTQAQESIAADAKQEAKADAKGETPPVTVSVKADAKAAQVTLEAIKTLLPQTAEDEITVKSGGNEAKFPAGSLVYYSKMHPEQGDDSKVKYVKKPDGSWWTVNHSTVSAYSPAFSDLSGLVAKGTLVPVSSPGELPIVSDDEIPGWAQAAIEKGEPLHSLDPEHMPWVKKLPGGASAAVGVATAGTVVHYYPKYQAGPGSEEPDYPWAWTSPGMLNESDTDPSKGWWEITKEKEKIYHPPAVSADEIPGWAQAAIEKGEPLHNLDPAAMPWVKKLPGAEKAVIPHSSFGYYAGKTSYLYCAPAIQKWTWGDLAPGKVSATYLSKGYWTRTSQGDLTYTPPSLPDQISGLLDKGTPEPPSEPAVTNADVLAWAKEHGSLGMAYAAGALLAKNLLLRQTKPNVYGNYEYIYKLGSLWVHGSGKPDSDYYHVSTGGYVSWNDQEGSHLLTPAQVMDLMQHDVGPHNPGAAPPPAEKISQPSLASLSDQFKQAHTKWLATAQSVGGPLAAKIGQVLKAKESYGGASPYVKPHADGWMTGGTPNKGVYYQVSANPFKVVKYDAGKGTADALTVPQLTDLLAGVPPSASGEHSILEFKELVAKLVPAGQGIGKPLAAKLAQTLSLHFSGYLVKEESGGWSNASGPDSGFHYKLSWPEGQFPSVTEVSSTGAEKVLTKQEIWQILSGGSPAPADVPDHATQQDVLDLAKKVAAAPGAAPLGAKLGQILKNQEAGQSSWQHIFAYEKVPGSGNWSASKNIPYAAGQYYEVKNLTVTSPAGNILSNGEIMALLKQSPGAEEAMEPGVPVAVNAKVVGEVPAGSKLYKDPVGYGWIIAHTPQGLWLKAGNSNVQPAPNYKTQEWEKALAEGELVEVQPPTPEDMAHFKKVESLKNYLATGAVSPSAKPGVGASGETQLAYKLAAKLKQKGMPSYTFTAYLYKGKSGEWESADYKPSADEFYEISTGTLEGVHHVLGKPDEPLPFSAVEAAVHHWVTPNATVITGKLYKHGHYYKPKGKAHLEIGAKSSQFLYYPVTGVPKSVSVQYAASWLQDATDYHEMPKGIPGEPPKLSYASAFKTDFPWYVLTPNGTASLEVKPDGSGVYNPPVQGEGPEAITAQAVGQYLQEGSLVDHYGTTVVKPGIQPNAYRLFGGSKQSSAVLGNALKKLEETGLSANVVLGLAAGSPADERMLAFLESRGAVTPLAQRDAIMTLLRELLSTPANKAASEDIKITYLKGLPPGVKTPKDIFTFSDLGYAHPFVWPVEYTGAAIAPVNFFSMTSPELVSRIKEISQQFGGGKVIGTHASSLSKDDRIKWLNDFKLGDMAAVFLLDAKGGKVSPAHPGAPDNKDTHQVTWGPWAQGEIPAVKEVPGDWSDHEKVTLPKAEITNYIIKAGLAHAEYLSAAERRSWVTWHRKHQQEMTDALSRTAHDRFTAQANPLTEVPAWTDDLKPATTYDVYVEEKTPAVSWTSQAKKDFIDSHSAEIQPFGEQWQKDTGYTSQGPEGWKGYHAGTQAVIQAWLDDAAAKEQAEKLKPRYHTVTEGPVKPGWTRVADQFGKFFSWNAADQLSQDRAQAVAALSKLWGFRTPETRLAELDGTQGIAHLVPESSSALADSDGIFSLSQREVSDLAREHVLDWVLDNPMSHPGELLRLPDGSMVGASKDSAFSGGGTWAGLALDGEQDHYAEQASGRLYTAIAQHEVSPAVADQAYIDTIRAATRMAQLPDSRFTQLLDQAHLDASQVKTLLGRKNSLASDFQGLWGKLYAQAGWKLPEVPKERLRFGLHSGFSEPSFFDHVIASKSYGVPAFFSGAGLQDSHFLVWTELAGKGPDASRLIRGESGARGEAMTALADWCKAHQTDGPQNVPTEPGVPPAKNASAFYAHVVNAAKAVSRHASDQLFEGPYTKGALEQMVTDKTVLEGRLATAENAIAAGPDSNAWAVAQNLNGHPVLVQDMAKYYLGLIEKVENAKANALTFKPGDLPDWVPPKVKTPEAPPKPPEPDIKVELKKAVRELGFSSGDVDSGQHHLLAEEDGELHLHGKTFTYPGNAWHLTLPTGEVIEFNDSGLTGTPDAHKGRIRFKADATQGSASLERIRAQLQLMGLPMTEAEDPDMELYYWRHLAGVLADRQDSQSGNHAKVWSSLKAYFDTHKLEWNSYDLTQNIASLANAHLAPQEEAELWRSAWANLTTPEQVQGFADKGGYLPHLNHWDVSNPEVPGGKPVWYRFDADPAFLASRKLVIHNFQNGERDALLVSRTGGLFSTEGRLRALGTSVTGMSSSADMNQHGSSGVFYTRLNKGDSEGHVKISPRVLAQTVTYGFSSDHYGDIGKRKHYAYFDIPKASAWSGGDSNETNIRDAISFLDDVELLRAYSEKQRQQIISELKAKGITEIRGIPVEQRVVQNFTSASLTGAKTALAAQASSWFDHPAVPWTAPPSGVISHAAIETEAELKEAPSAEPGALTQEIEGKTASADHGPGAAESAVSQVFYQQPSKPSVSEQQASDTKHVLAQRLSGEMNVSTAELQALYQGAGLSAPDGWGDTIREQAIAALINTWAKSNSSPISAALQNEATQLFAPPGEHLEKAAGAYESDSAAVKELEEKYGPVLREFLRAQWAATQSDLENAGISHVTLYRIFKWGDSSSAPDWAKNVSPGTAIPVPAQRPLAPWGFLQSGAEGAGTFGSGGHSVVVKATFPREALLSYPRSGFGCYGETEFVALNVPGSWEVVK